MPETSAIGLLAQAVLAVSIVPYSISIFRGTVKPNRISWFIWSVIGLAFWLVTPEDADRVTKMLTIIFMVNPAIVFVLTLFKGAYFRPDRIEIFSLLMGLAAIATWFVLRESSGILPISIAIFADFCALLPTLRFVYRSPEEEKPMAWICFFGGSFMALFGIEDYSLASLLLPAYMTLGASLVVWPLLRYRLANGIALRNWII